MSIHPAGCDCPSCSALQRQFDAFLVSVLFLILVVLLTRS